MLGLDVGHAGARRAGAGPRATPASRHRPATAGAPLDEDETTTTTTDLDRRVPAAGSSVDVLA